jgi:galacturonosyltransferase
MKAIVDDGFEVYISEPDDDERVKYFEEIGCHVIKTVFDRRGMNPVADMRLLMAYIKLIKKTKPVAVLTYTIKPNGYGGMACRWTGVPLLANITGLGDAIENGGWLKFLILTMFRISIPNAKCVFYQNRTNKEFLESHGIVAKKSVMIPGSGVNLQHHKFQDYPSDGIIKFLFISRLLKDKGTEEFFEMVKTIKAKYSNTEFQILGWVEGDYEEQLDDFVKKGLVNYLGSTTDVRPYLAQAHCTIMPSYHEGMSNVNLESSANGRPVITTNVPGCRETVDDGRSGYLVDVRSVESLTNAVERFIILPYNQKKMMGKNARRKMEREFDRQIVVKAYVNELNSLLL